MKSSFARMCASSGSRHLESLKKYLGDELWAASENCAPNCAELRADELRAEELRAARGVRRLLHPLDGGAGGRQPVDELALGVERLVAHRVPPLVLAEVDVAAVEQLAPQRLRRRRVPALGRPDELVAREVVHGEQRAEGVGDAVGERLRRLARRLRRLLHLLAVLVRPRQEEHVVAVEPLEARDHVARQRGVRVADVRLAVHVVDRRGDEVRRLVRRWCSCSAQRHRAWLTGGAPRRELVERGAARVEGAA